LPKDKQLFWHYSFRRCEERVGAENSKEMKEKLGCAESN